MSAAVVAKFYTKLTFTDFCIRLRTLSSVSHVELYLPDSGESFSASSRDGGVRVKQIAFKSYWLGLPVPNADPEQVRDFYQRTRDCGYDWLGLFGAQAIGRRSWHYQRKWFCSEWCAAALGLDDPAWYSPQRLLLALVAQQHLGGTSATQAARLNAPAPAARQTAPVLVDDSD